MFSGGIEVEHWLEKGRNNYFVNTEMYMSNRKQKCLVENTVFQSLSKHLGKKSSKFTTEEPVPANVIFTDGFMNNFKLLL